MFNISIFGCNRRGCEVMTALGGDDVSRLPSVD